MKKNYLFVMALAAMVSCSSDEFVGDSGSPNVVNGNGGEKAIAFASNTPRITRAEGSAAATVLGNKFKVYAVKKIGTTYSNVFAKNGYDSGDTYNASPYWVWYTASTAGSTTSNTKDWEYVGTGGTVITSGFGAEQTIKYWDYGADQYEFVAYSATVGSPTITKYKKDGFTVQATAEQLAGLYVADKLTITDKNNSPSIPASGSSTVNKIGDVVRFTFRSAATKVRLGIYETIPGYVVQNVNFRPNASEFTATKSKAMLSGSFNGTSSTASGTFNVTYANSSPQIAVFASTAPTEQVGKYFDFGTFAAENTAIGITSTAPTWASGSSEYQSVFPNTDHVANMILYVDYDLYNSTSGETINVKGAKAVVPSIYMKWNPNYAYTYLFKISDNTNGTTGTESTSPVGLFPITFDAVTIAATDGQEVGTITTVSTPAITTYQNGSVSASGIAYASAKGAIYITVNDGGTLKDLTTSGIIKLYTVDTGTTEADLILNVKTKTEVTSGTDMLTVPLSQAVTLQGMTFATSTTAEFTPRANTTYAVEYKVSDEITAVYTAVANGTTLTKDKKYYTSNAGAGEFISNGTEVSDGTNYFEKTAGSPAVYQYKIIEVGS